MRSPDVEILNENAKKRNESDEPVVLAQCRFFFESRRGQALIIP